MFAFCVYDRNAARLFLARDRFGKKPLYWTAAGGAFAFASELTSLLHHPGVSRDLDALGLQALLRLRVHPRAAHALPGRRASCRAGTASTSTSRPRRRGSDAYYRFTVEPDEALASRPEGEVAEDLRARLSAAVRPAPGGRRAARHLPVRRHRLQRGRRLRRARDAASSASRPSPSASGRRASTSRRTRARWPRTPAPSTTRRSSTSPRRARSRTRCWGCSTSRSATARSCRPTCSRASRASA